MTESTPTLFRHSKRPDWGLAVIAWERDGKRGYLFESGMLRVLAEPFYRLMSPVTKITEADAATLHRLVSQLDVGASGLHSSRAAQAPALRFAMSEQLSYFTSEYEDGFEGAWQRSQRGLGAKRRLKRHRDGAIAQAQEDLSPKALQDFVESGDAAGAWKAVAKVVASTDLVPTSQLDLLKKEAGRANVQGVEALAAVLYGDEDLSARFEAYVAALQSVLRKAPSWELVTSVLALVHPKEHVCVRRTSFQTQADWLLPEFKADKRVSALSYSGFSHLAKMVCEQLEQAGLHPSDYLDVHDFIKLTTSPSSQSRMLAAQHQATVSAEAEDEVGAEEAAA